MTEIFISPEDLKTLFRRLQRKLGHAAIISGALVFVVCLWRGAVYEAEATFRQSTGRVEQNIEMKNFIKTILSQDIESSAISLMLSQKVLKDTVQTLGLQVQIEAPKTFKPFDTIRAELGFSLPEVDSFTFRDVFYGSLEPLSMDLRFISFDMYELLNSKGKRITAVKIGEAVSEEGFKLTLEKIPANLKIGKKYSLTLLPWREAIAFVKKRLSIKPTKLDKNVLLLSYASRNRDLSPRVLNQLMASYQRFLEEENKSLMHEQIAYLSKRQEEINSELEKILAEHVSHLKANVDIQEGSHSLSETHAAYTSKLFDLEYDLARLENIHQEEGKETGQKLEEALFALNSLEKGEALKNIPPSLSSLLAGVKEAAPHAKERLTTHLHSLVENLQRHQKALNEVSDPDFRSIDLVTAKNLYLGYMHELDTLHVRIHQLQFFLQHIMQTDFELSSLCNVLTDSITQEMVHKAGDLELQLQDELNHSGKEHGRVREALLTQKRFISHHLSQTVELEKIHADLVKEKILSLQKSMIDLVKNEKHLVEQRLGSLREKMADLPEKWRLENQLKFKTELTKSIVEGLSEFTESKNLSSHLYQVESKPIDAALLPYSPRPPRLFLFSFTAAIFGAFFTYLYHLLKGIIQGLPLSLSHLKLLQAPTCGELSSNADSPFSDLLESDLETIRKIANFVLSHERGSVVTLFNGKNTNFSENLAHLLSLHGIKPIVVECDFTSIVSIEDVPGLWHFLMEETPSLPIRSRETFDLIKTSGTTNLATELLSQEKFSSALASLKLKYDCILLFSTAPHTSTEAAELLRQSDAAIVAFSDQTIDDVESFRQKEKSHVTFVKCEATVF